MQIDPLIRRQRLAVMFTFILHGTVLASWVSRIPAVQIRLGLSEGALGLTLVGASTGVLLSLSAVGGLIARFGSRQVTIIGSSLMFLCLPLLALSPNQLSLWVTLFLFGSGISIMDVAMNDQAVLVERAAGQPLMSSFHAGFSIGGLLGALIGAGMAAFPAGTPLLHFMVVAALAATSLTLVSLHLVPTGKSTGEKPPAFRLPERAVWMLGVIAFCSAIGEGAMESWSGVYLTRIFATSESFAALGFAAFSVTMTVGRFLGDALSKRWSPERIIRLGGLAAAAGWAAAVLTTEPVVVLIGFAAVGIGLANIIPLTFSAAGNAPGLPAGVGIAGVATIGYAGFLAGPPVIGLLSDATSLRVGLALVGVLAGTLVLLARAVSGNRRQQGK
jgi:predicted MFS family arabinose efflux permease